MPPFAFIETYNRPKGETLRTNCAERYRTGLRRFGERFNGFYRKIKEPGRLNAVQHVLVSSEDKKPLRLLNTKFLPLSTAIVLC